MGIRGYLISSLAGGFVYGDIGMDKSFRAPRGPLKGPIFLPFEAE